MVPNWTKKGIRKRPYSEVAGVVNGTLPQESGPPITPDHMSIKALSTKSSSAIQINDENVNSRNIQVVQSKNVSKKKGKKRKQTPEEKKNFAERMAKGRAEKRRKQAAQTAIDELNKDVSEIVDESEVIEEEECVGNRRSSRSRVSRYMQIDGQTVLKANNYTMEQGELSVYSREARGTFDASSNDIKRPVRNAYMLFMSEFEAPTEDNRPYIQQASETWQGLSDAKRMEFKRRHQQMEEKWLETVENNKRKAQEKIAAEKLADQNRQILANKQRDEEWQKLNEKRKMSKAAKMKAQGKDRVFDLSTIEGRRLKHNKSMKAERESVIALRNTVFAYYRNNLKGFTENIPHALSTSEYDVMTAGLVDTEGAPCVSQPSIIVNGTMRNYQLKSLEWLLWMYVRFHQKFQFYLFSYEISYLTNFIKKIFFHNI